MFVHKFQTTLEVLKAPCSYLSRKNDLSFAYRKCFSAFSLSRGGRHAPSEQHEWAQTSKNQTLILLEIQDETII